MIKKSRVLVDAVVVIGAHEQRYWEPLCNSYHIALPATILEEEVFYFHCEDGKKGLSPSTWLAEGKVERLEAGVADHKHLCSKLSANSMKSLDPGELEALALLGSSTYKNYRFTTADRAAIKALGVLGWGERGVSVEELLQKSGAHGPQIKKLPQHFTKKWFQARLHEGVMERHLWVK